MARVENFAKLMQALQAELDARIDEDRGFYNVPAEKLLAMTMALDKRLADEVEANTLQVGGIDFDNYKGTDVEPD